MLLLRHRATDISCSCLLRYATRFFRAAAYSDADVTSMSELGKMEEAEEQGFLEDVDTLQAPEEHTRNLVILKEQKSKRTK